MNQKEIFVELKKLITEAENNNNYLDLISFYIKIVEETNRNKEKMDKDIKNKLSEGLELSLNIIGNNQELKKTIELCLELLKNLNNNSQTTKMNMR